MNWDLLIVGATIALSPISVVAFILLVGTDRGARKGAAFLAGWVVCLVAIIGGTVLLTGGHPPRPKTVPGTGVSVVTILLGVVLLAVAARAEGRRRRGEKKQKKEPKWMSKLDELSLLAALSFGVLLQPWGLVAAGAAAATDTDTGHVSATVSLVVFGVLATSTLILMEAWVVLQPERANARLADLRTWVDDHRDRAIAVLSLVVGVVLILKGIRQLRG